jgi:hypothetical protein
MIVPRYPAVVVHGLADARAVLAGGEPVTLLSAEGAALYAGSGWWQALIARATAGHPNIICDNILDCADASGIALGALRIGQRWIVLHPSAPGWAQVAATAKSLHAVILAHRPAALDMAQRGAAHRLQEWLRSPNGQRDSEGGVS